MAASATAYLWIAFGSAVGGVLRFWLSTMTGRWFETLLGAPHTFAFLGTVFVNVTGSFLIGFLSGAGTTPLGRQIFMIGVLGGYTTFSAFSLQTLELAHEGRWLHAGGNVVASVVFALAAVWLGHWCGAAFRK